MTNKAYFPLRRGLEDFLERKFHMAMIAANCLVLTTAYSHYDLWKIFHRPHCCRKDKVVIILCIVISLFMNCPKYFVLVCIVICKFYFHRKDRYVKHCFNYLIDRTPSWKFDPNAVVLVARWIKEITIMVLERHIVAGSICLLFSYEFVIGHGRHSAKQNYRWKVTIFV